MRAVGGRSADDDADGGKRDVGGGLLGRLVAIGVIDEAVAVDLGVTDDCRNGNVGTGGVAAVDIDGGRVLAPVGGADGACDLLA